MASNQLPFGIGAGNVYNGGGPPNLSSPQAERFQPMGFNFGQTQNPMQPQSPDVSGAAGFQHVTRREAHQLLYALTRLSLQPGTESPN